MRRPASVARLHPLVEVVKAPRFEWVNEWRDRDRREFPFLVVGITGRDVAFMILGLGFVWEWRR